MEKKEFLDCLREYLSGEVSGPVIESNIRYYDSYISEHSSSLEEERRCIEEIGNPRLIATTIITSCQMSNDTTYNQETEYRESVQEDEKEEPFSKSILQMIPLRYKIIGILSIICILFVLFFIAKALLPVFVIAIVFIAIDRLFRR